MNHKDNNQANAPISHAEMTFDFDGLIQLLAGHLYSEKKVFIRELVQNAHDAIVRRAVDDPAFDREQGRIHILTDLTAAPGRIIFRDNGLGMSRTDLERFLSTVGKSGTRAASGDAPDVIGQFGIGFLSGFVVGARVEVRTRAWQEPPEAGSLWENDGTKDYSIQPCRVDEPGTEVIVHLDSAADRGLIQDEAVKKVIRDYADMLRIPVYLNDPSQQGTAVNQRIMPWERTDQSDRDLRLDCLIYLEKTVPDSVLEVIPVREQGEHGVDAQGLLYITRTRVVGTDAPRTIRVFLKRMFLCEDAKELLPPWATFVNGIVNTRDLSPNAARDNFARDEAHQRLRDRLGDIIVAHFEHLRDAEPQRLSEILAYHDFGIKAACHYYDRFFEKFGHLLEWRINARSPAVGEDARKTGRRTGMTDEAAAYAWARLDQVMAALPAPADGAPKRLPCFTTHSSANQYFEMADAAGTTVLDASWPFESKLLKTWAKAHDTEVNLVYVDREDDPNVFRDADPEHDRAVRALAQQMSLNIRPGGTGRLRVEARRFEPVTLPAVLKHTEASVGSQKARDILNDPNSPSDLRSMAEDMLRMARNADMRMSINAANPLVRTLAELIALAPEDDDLQDLAIGIYNDAILYNQELMTPTNARLFHEQFQRLMGRSLEFVRQKAEIARQQAELATQRAAMQPHRGPARTHLVAFLMTPFARAFDAPREAIRGIVEDGYGCELLTADKKTFDDFIHGNVDRHIRAADLFIADVTGANPNVMMELGAAIYGAANASTGNGEPRPRLLVAANDEPELPADLKGHITARYPRDAEPAHIAEALADAFAKHQPLKTLLERPGRERFLSPAVLAEYSDHLLRAPVYAQLSERLPTAGAWRRATEADIERLLGRDSDLAPILLRRIHTHLDEGGVVDVRGANLGGVFAGEGDHLGGHVDAKDLARFADHLRGEEAVDAAAGAEVEHHLAGLERGDGRGIAAAERHVGDRRRELGCVRVGIELRDVGELDLVGAGVAATAGLSG